MIYAYLFIHLNQDQIGEDVIQGVNDIPQVKFAHRLYGTYDMVIFMETESTTDLKNVTLESVRALKFVESTVTFIALESFARD